MSMARVEGRCKPRVGVVGAAYPGFHLGEEMAEAKFQQMVDALAGQPLDLCVVPAIVTDTDSARATGQQLGAEKPDCLLIVLTTFIPDTFVVDLLRECDVPVFLWAIEREIDCLALVCGPMITASLYNLQKPYSLHASDIPDDRVCGHLLTFARAAMLRRMLRQLRVGYMGGKPSIMFSMSTDEYTLVEKLGVTVENIPIQELYDRAAALPAPRVQACWDDLTVGLGPVEVACADGLQSSRFALAAQDLAEEYHLNALSINCFPHLKAKICLATALLNDAGIAAACEGDLHSTILMYLLQGLSGSASFNGDVFRLYPEDNSILFSHCGTGAFSLAPSRCDVCLQSSIETHDGLAVKYPTHMPGPVTLINLMLGRGTLRIIAMEGEGVDTDLSYEGTPLRVQFTTDVQEILQGIARSGAGHHWNGCPGAYVEAFRLLCEWVGVEFTGL